MVNLSRVWLFSVGYMVLLGPSVQGAEMIWSLPEEVKLDPYFKVLIERTANEILPTGKNGPHRVTLNLSEKMGEEIVGAENLGDGAVVLRLNQRRFLDMNLKYQAASVQRKGFSLGSQEQRAKEAESEWAKAKESERSLRLQLKSVENALGHFRGLKEKGEDVADWVFRGREYPPFEGFENEDRRLRSEIKSAKALTEEKEFAFRDAQADLVDEKLKAQDRVNREFGFAYFRELRKSKDLIFQSLTAPKPRAAQEVEKEAGVNGAFVPPPEFLNPGGAITAIEPMVTDIRTFKVGVDGKEAPPSIELGLDDLGPVQ